MIHQAHFALEVKAKALPLYEQVFNVEFPLPKLDTLVVCFFTSLSPYTTLTRRSTLTGCFGSLQAADFDAGAMENWGLITGRTTAFLFDPQKSELSAKKRVAQVQAHEVRARIFWLSKC